MDLGQFSLSLAVADIARSKAFYQKLGFAVLDDHTQENWVIMRQGSTVIGLFQGMFEHNTLTFNPRDVRAVQRHLKEQGLELMREADESAAGPDYLILVDPDGNPILIDQYDPSYQPASG